MNTIKLKRDIVIPAGTLLNCVDGVTRSYCSGNYEAIFDLSKDSHGSLVYNFEPLDPALSDWFEEIQ